MNRRSASRLPMKREATVAIGEIAARDGLTLDISTGGIGVLVPFSVTVGANVYVETDLPGPDGPKRFEAQCTVRTATGLRGSDSHLLGLQFANLRAPCARALAEFINMY